MGSSGHGKFENYSERNNFGVNNSPSTGMNVSTNIGNGEVEKCPTELPTIKLEDVQTSQYHLKRQELPQVGDEVYLSNELHNGRLVVVHTDSNLIIGNLPTSYNYMVKCLNHNYTGSVVSAGMQPIPFVVVDLHV